MDVRDMLATKLRECGMNGLYNPEQRCGCHLGDLMPCVSARPGCEAVVRVAGCSDICGLGCDFHIS